MKLIDAIRAGEKNPDQPLPINAGQCEYPWMGGGFCGARGRWWVRHHFRCSQHKDK